MAEDRDQKTERATGKRRSEARQKGQVARSREVGSAAVLIASFLVLATGATGLGSGMADLTRRILDGAGTAAITTRSLHEMLIVTTSQVGFILAPLLGAALLAGVTANVAQVGFLWTGEPLAPKGSRINPIAGFKRLVSLTAAVELAKSIVKIFVLSYAAYLSVRGLVPELTGLVQSDAATVAFFFLRVTLRILGACSLVLIVLAALDYAYQRFDYEKNLRMTKQEVKDEHRQQEGDPLIRSRIRSLQMQAARRRMMSQVPKADVVITNPTHFAVALQYEAGEMRAPTVVAKGAGLVAERIRETARAAGVPVVENAPLARTLHKLVEIGREIPAALYQTVAEVLAYVYRADRKRTGLGIRG